jgi:peptidoglycan/xylan/chitin deacetylase (PgdA/CDA1 family)
MHVEGTANKRAVALMYHGVLDKPRRRYDVLPERFERQLQQLATERILSWTELLAGESGVALTFDDGDASCLSVVAPRLQARRWHATAYVTTAFLGRSGFLEKKELTELVSAGFTVGAHGHTHRFLDSLTERETLEELRRSRAILEDALGASVIHMALPGGRGGKRVCMLARSAGFQSVANSWPAPFRSQRTPYGVPRVSLLTTDGEREFADVVAWSATPCARRQLRVAATIAGRALLGERPYQRCKRFLQGLMRSR